MDTTTAYLIVALGALANGLLFLMLQGQLTGESRSAARVWLSGTLAIAAGCLTFLLPWLVPQPFRLLLANGLITAGLIAYSVAVRQFYRRHLYHGALWAALALVIAGLFVFQVWWPSVQARVVLTAIIWSLIMGCALQTLWRRNEARYMPAASALIGLYACVALALLARGVYFLVVPYEPTFSITDNASWVNRLTPFLALLLPSIGSSAFLMLIQQSESRLVRQQALTDPLTGLGNRGMLVTLSSRVHPDTDRSWGFGAVFMLDLDGFKEINDTLGHAAGDDVLVDVARRLQTLAEPQDVVVRLGGDEFALIAREHLPLDAAQALANRVQQSIAGHYYAGGRRVSLGASVGAAIATETGGPVALESLLAAADSAMYDAKRRGGGYEVSDVPPAAIDSVLNHLAHEQAGLNVS